MTTSVTRPRASTRERPRPWCNVNIGGHGPWLTPASSRLTGTANSVRRVWQWTRTPNESGRPGKSMAVDACRQRRRRDRRLPAQGKTTALRPLYSPPGRLSFRLHQACADRRSGGVVYGSDTGVAGVRDRGHCLVRHARPLYSVVPEDFWFRGKAPAALHIHGGFAVLPEEFHAHARTFRHLWLRRCHLSAAAAGALDCLRAARSAVLDRPHSDPSHSSADVCTDHRGDRDRQILSGCGRE